MAADRHRVVADMAQRPPGIRRHLVHGLDALDRRLNDENPYKAAAAGAVVGLGGAVVWHKVFAVKGGLAVRGCVYGAGTDALMFNYPLAKKHGAQVWEAAATGLTQADHAVRNAGQRARSQASDFLRKNGLHLA